MFFKENTYKEKSGMRDTCKYHLKDGKRVIHLGITNNLKRREQEHQSNYPGAQIRQIGRKTTREYAISWERNGGLR